MASFFNNLFGRSSSSRGTSPHSNATSPTLSPPPIPHSIHSPSLVAQMPPEASSTPPGSRRVPFFFREENTSLIVKGNFMTLAAKPEHVEKGEWLAHQIVEQYRLLECMIKIIQETDTNTKQPICNPATCPTMSAAEFTYTWLDNQRNPIRIPAAHYITLVQRWILGKIQDHTIFPTTEPTSNGIAAMSAAMDAQQQAQLAQNAALAAGDVPPLQSIHSQALTGLEKEWLGKPSGFPPSFELDIKSLYRQMFRCYAHLYHGHWLDPFYHIGAYKELNTCFIHFINVGRLYDLINEKDLRPMQPLIDIWVSKGLLAADTNSSSTTAASPASSSQPARISAAA